ncbi:ABC transporter ATP-binding protein [Frigoribacterium sp. RIT-PI-h]|uniref:ABC transporter ATP-binding protein n=1 Tax=Frigoribacterium sp. RIT-PI-h TaxID=1690245 RepID=UPI0006B8CC58|nr:ATP-binding cassette domain-containing protein [Frigoribacterium sp. RIT-PI-h]KPG75049.1 multidrug ABC transporter ATP-binding protein [Frigoribacterium sp. RIT-PI-h]
MTKQFGRQRAVDGVDLAVPHGSVYGFLGPNGSGKTSTIRMLLGLTSASSGVIRVLGGSMPDDLRRILPRVGALVEGPAFYPFLSGRANLHRLDSGDRSAPAATRRARVDAALDRVGLGHAASKKAHAYSLGMKQRLGIANALLMPRDLLVLDEPSNGLDPQGTREVRTLIRSLADEGTTVFVSSHLLSEVEQMCTHIGVMSAGRLLTQGTLDDLRALGTHRVRLLTPDPDAARDVLVRLGLTPEARARPDATPATAGGSVSVEAELAVEGLSPESIVVALVAADVRARGCGVAGAGLEDRFVDLAGEGFDVAG